MVVGVLKAAVFFVVLSSGSLSAFLTRMANERLRVLEEVEKDIAVVLQCAGEETLSTSLCAFAAFGVSCFLRREKWK